MCSVILQESSLAGLYGAAGCKRGKCGPIGIPSLVKNLGRSRSLRSRQLLLLVMGVMPGRKLRSAQETDLVAQAVPM